jgi:hypothetical protein
MPRAKGMSDIENQSLFIAPLHGKIENDKSGSEYGSDGVGFGFLHRGKVSKWINDLVHEKYDSTFHHYSRKLQTKWPHTQITVARPAAISQYTAPIISFSRNKLASTKRFNSSSSCTN